MEQTDKSARHVTFKLEESLERASKSETKKRNTFNSSSSLKDSLKKNSPKVIKTREYLIYPGIESNVYLP